MPAREPQGARPRRARAAPPPLDAPVSQGRLRAPRRRRGADDHPPGAPQRGRRRDRRRCCSSGFRQLRGRRRGPRPRAHRRGARGVLRRRRPEGVRRARERVRAATTRRRRSTPGSTSAPTARSGFTRLTPSKPTIAAISGWCLAGGLELALWCDLRVATADARLGFTERRFGVPLIDGGTQRLPRIVGMGRALEMILTGRVVEAAEALDWGLVNEVVGAGAAPRAGARDRRGPGRVPAADDALRPPRGARGHRAAVRATGSRSRPSSAATR